MKRNRRRRRVDKQRQFQIETERKEVNVLPVHTEEQPLRVETEIEEGNVMQEEKKKRLEWYKGFFWIVSAVCLCTLGVRAIDFNTTEYWWFFASIGLVSTCFFMYVQSLLEKW